MNMESKVENLIFMERSEPKRRLLRSDGALYLALLLAVVGTIVLGYDLSERFNWPRIWVQLILYVLLVAAGYMIYRFRLTAFRYTLTTRVFSVDRLIGSKEKNDAHVRLKEIRSIERYGGWDPSAEGKRSVLCLGKKEQSTAIAFNTSKGMRTILVAISLEHRKELIEAWKNAR